MRVWIFQTGEPLHIDKEKDWDIIAANQYFDSGSAAKIAVEVDKKYIKSNSKDAFFKKNKFTQCCHSEYLSSCNYKGEDGMVKRTSMEYYLDINSYFPYSDMFQLQKIQ